MIVRRSRDAPCLHGEPSEQCPHPNDPVDQPYRVQLEAVPDRFQKDTVWVHDQVVVGNRRIVR
jgi:hypothetical protein